MGRRRWLEWARDDLNKVVGGDNVQGYMYEAGTSTLATLYDTEAGAGTIANPHRAHPGWETTLSATAAPAATQLTVASTTGITAGDILKLRSGANEVERFVKSVDSATLLTLSEAVGGAFTYPIGATVGGQDLTGSWGALLDDAKDYEFAWKNVATGKFSARRSVPVKVTAATIAVQEEGSTVGTRGTVNFIGSTVTAVDNGGQSRVDVTVKRQRSLFLAGVM